MRVQIVLLLHMACSTITATAAYAAQMATAKATSHPEAQGSVSQQWQQQQLATRLIRFGAETFDKILQEVPLAAHPSLSESEKNNSAASVQGPQLYRQSEKDAERKPLAAKSPSARNSLHYGSVRPTVGFTTPTSSNSYLQHAPQQQQQQQQQKQSHTAATAAKASESHAQRYAADSDDSAAIGNSRPLYAAIQPEMSSISSSKAISKRSTITASTTITAASQPLFGASIMLPNPFSIFTPQFWGLSSPSTTQAPPTTRKPPKKYKSTQKAADRTVTTTKEEKLRTQTPRTGPKANETKAPDTDNATIENETEDGPFRIALPTFDLATPKKVAATENEKGKRDAFQDLREYFSCPRESEVRFQLFPKICETDRDCDVWQREELCCDIFGAKSCVSGIAKPLDEPEHEPILGLIPRKCPEHPLAELWWDVKECENDWDCWPRICCPDGRKRYCRTSQPELTTVPEPVQRSLSSLTDYLECTPPPPVIFDLHPKACTSTLDCFPNVCCQEAGLRHCRPPKKSVLTMLSNILNVDFVKRLTQNIVIK